MVFDEKRTEAYLGAAAGSGLDPCDFFFFLGAIGRLFDPRHGKWAQRS